MLFGDALVRNAPDTRIAPAPREIVLTANLPRDGALGNRLAGVTFSPTNSPAGKARPAGAAWLVGDVLVLARPGYGPAIEHLEGIVEGVVR